MTRSQTHAKLYCRISMWFLILNTGLKCVVQLAIQEVVPTGSVIGWDAVKGKGTSGHGFFMASDSFTKHPSGPAMLPMIYVRMYTSSCSNYRRIPLSTTIPFSVSTFRTLTFCVVTCCPPIRPAIFFPGSTLEPPP